MRFLALLLASTQLCASSDSPIGRTPHHSPEHSPRRQQVDLKIDTDGELTEPATHPIDTDTPSPSPKQQPAQQTFSYNTPPPSPSNFGFLLCAVAVGAVAIAAQAPERTPVEPNKGSHNQPPTVRPE